MSSLLARALRRARRIVLGPEKPVAGIQYWERRVRDHGRRAVLNLGHSDEEFERFTAWQWDQLSPSLRAQLRGDEKSILDFGCGAGRFTPELARLIGGRAIGVDPIPRLLEIPGGLVFLADNVEDKPDKPTFCFRPESFYRDLFAFAPLERVHSYDDLGETITVMAGRKR
jgi:SAM-dependent methyltransferase